MRSARPRRTGWRSSSPCGWPCCPCSGRNPAGMCRPWTDRTSPWDLRKTSRVCGPEKSRGVSGSLLGNWDESIPRRCLQPSKECCWDGMKKKKFHKTSKGKCQSVGQPWRQRLRGKCNLGNEFKTKKKWCTSLRWKNSFKLDQSHEKREISALSHVLIGFRLFSPLMFSSSSYYSVSESKNILGKSLYRIEQI